MLSEFPDDWTPTKLGLFASEVRDRSNGTEEVLSVTKHRGFVPSMEYFGKQIFSKDTDNYKIVKRGQYAYATIHLDEGSIDCLAIRSEGIISPMYTVFDVDDDVVERSFLLALLQAPWMLMRYAAIGEGSVNRRKSITFDALAAETLHLPPLPEQKKIAAILSSVDEAIQATQAVIEQTRRVKEGLLQDLLTRGIGVDGVPHTRFKQTEIGEIPESWEVLGLFDVADLQHGKSFPSSDYGDSGIYLVRPGNLHVDNMVMWDEAHTTSLPEHHWDESPDHRVGEGELLMNLTAQSLADNFLGRVCMTPTGTRCLLNQRIGRLTARDQVTTEYLFWCLQGPQFREHIRTRGQGSKVQHLYNRDLGTARLPIPTLHEQEVISQRLWDARAAVERQVDLLGSQQSVKAGLLQDLLTGKVRVSV